MGRYGIKRNILRASGVLEYLWRTIKPGLYVFNYHRIGDPTATPFDPNVFSCDQEHFARHITFLKSRFKLIDGAQLQAMVAAGAAPREPLAMISFDDGYRDNYTLAYPVLRDAGVSGIFFLPTSYIGDNRVPWWDEAAWLVKNSQTETLHLPQWSQSVAIDRANIDASIRLVLNQVKRDGKTSLEDKLGALQQACGCEMPADAGTELFMSWDEAREMSEGGMDIGSHTHSHNILAHLSTARQKEELIQSKQILEAQLGQSVDILAYPVGGHDSYTEDTCSLARDAGYEVAFTFIYGYNPTPADDPFQLRRIPVENNFEPTDLKFSTAFARAP